MMEGEVHSREYIVLSRSRVCSQEQLVDVAENQGRGSFQLEIQNNNNNDNNKNKNKWVCLSCKVIIFLSLQVFRVRLNWTKRFLRCFGQLVWLLDSLQVCDYLILSISIYHLVYFLIQKDKISWTIFKYLEKVIEYSSFHCCE